MEIQLIWEIIKRRKWVLIQAFLAVFVTIVIGTLMLTPVYKSTAKIIIQKSDVESDLLSGIELSSKSTALAQDETFLANQLEIAAAGEISEKVISELNLTDKKGDLLKPEKLTTSSFIASKIFPPNVKVKDIEDTDIVNIEARSTDPDQAAKIANTFVDAFIEYNVNAKKEKYSTAKRYVEQQLNAVKKEFINTLEDIKKFQLDSQVLDIQKETSEAISQLYNLMNLKENNITSISETRAKITELKQQLAQQDENKVSSTTLNENKYIQQLKMDINDLELQLEEIKTEKAETHPDVLILMQKLKKAKESLKAEVNLNNTFSDELQDLERELAALEARHQGLNSRIQQYMNDLSVLPGKMATQTQLDFDLGVKQNLYNNLLEYFYQVVVLENTVFSDIRLVAAASAPDPGEYDSPNKALNGIMGIFLGLTFGFILCFLTEYMDDSVKGIGDLKQQGLTVLGSIPKIDQQTENILQDKGWKDRLSTLFPPFKGMDPSSVLLLNRGTKDRLFDFYHVIRNNLKLTPKDKALNSLMVVSAKKGEGRSSIVINLGTLLAREGKKVLIIDADFQNPSLLEKLGIMDSEESLDPGSAIRNIDTVDGLNVWSIAHLYHTPADVVESEKANQIISDLKKKYDMLIFDSSPLNTSTHAAFLTQFTDALILVVESGGISQKKCERTVEYLKRMEVFLAGAIVNKFVIRRNGDLL